MHTHVGDVGQPPGGGIVEVFERVEVAAAQQVLLDVIERPFHLALGLGAAWPASPGPEAVVRGEGQKAWVVERFAVLVILHDHLEVVVQAGGRHAAQMVEGGDVLPERGVKILTLDKTQILPP